MWPISLPGRGSAMREFTVTVLGGERFPCREDEPLLAAMRRAGCGPITHGCYGGGCGVCKMKLVSGKVKQFQPMSRAHITPQEEREGYILLCCAKPLSEVQIESIDPKM